MSGFSSNMASLGVNPDSSINNVSNSSVQSSQSLRVGAMNRSASLRTHKLTVNQCNLLKELWPNLDHYELGAYIYRTVFDQYPVVLQMFHCIRDQGPTDENEEFIKQVAVLIDFFTECIQMCTDHGALTEHARAAGKRHQKFADRGIRPEHWYSFRAAFKTAMTKYLLHDDELVSAGERSTVIQAWCTFTSNIVNEMKAAYTDGLPETDVVPGTTNGKNEKSLSPTRSPRAGTPTRRLLIHQMSKSNNNPMLADQGNHRRSASVRTKSRWSGLSKRVMD